MYDEEIANAHRNGDLHLHDLSMLTGYCAGWSLKQLIQQGLGIPGKINSTPASHLSTLCNQMVNFLGIMQNEWAGAQAFSSFDTYLAPFVSVDKPLQKEVKQCIQSFIFGVNTPSRWGTQAPFSNITLDWTVPADLRDLPAIVGGKEQDFTYGDCQKEMDMVNKAFIEIMTEGDANGRGFQYPIPTYSITKDFDWSETGEQPPSLRDDRQVRHAVLLQLHQLRHGTERRALDVLPSEAGSARAAQEIRRLLRLRREHRLGRRRDDQYAAIAYLSKTEDEFYQRLDHMMDIAARSLKTKRTVITKLFTSSFMGGGAVKDLNERTLSYKDIWGFFSWGDVGGFKTKAQEFTKAVLNHMRERLSDYQEKYGDLYNLEATPPSPPLTVSPSTMSQPLPRSSPPRSLTAPRTTPTAPTCPWATRRIFFSALDIQDDLQTLYTSGTVFHAFLGEKLPDWTRRQSRAQDRRELKLPYYTMTPTYSVCQDHGYITGEHFTCPKCGKETEVWSRITGYYRPVQNWNDGKVQEFKDRKGVQYRPQPLHRRHPPPRGLLRRRYRRPRHAAEEVGTVSAAHTAQLFTHDLPELPRGREDARQGRIAYENLTAEEHPELCREYGIKGADARALRRCAF